MKNVNRRQFLKTGLAGILGIGASGCMITTTPTDVADALGGAFGFLSPYSFKIDAIVLNDYDNDGKFSGSEIKPKTVFNPDESIGILVKNSSLGVVDVSAIVRDKAGNIMYANEGRLNKNGSILFQGIKTNGEGYETYFVEAKIKGTYVDFHTEKKLEFVVNHS